MLVKQDYQHKTQCRIDLESSVLHRIASLVSKVCFNFQKQICCALAHMKSKEMKIIVRL